MSTNKLFFSETDFHQKNTVLVQHFETTKAMAKHIQRHQQKHLCPQTLSA
jgi:hypothetical protein